MLTNAGPHGQSELCKRVSPPSTTTHSRPSTYRSSISSPSQAGQCTNMLPHSIARTTGSLLLERNSVIRNLTNWGVFDLPRPTVKYQTQHHKGHYFVMQFDCSATTQQEVRRQLGLNPHMIRFSVVKLGDKLGGYRNQKGKIEDVVGDGRKEWGGLREDVDALDAFKY